MSQFSQRELYRVDRDIAHDLGLDNDLSLAEFTTSLRLATLLPGDDMLSAEFSEIGDLDFVLARQKSLAKFQKQELQERLFDRAATIGRTRRTQDGDT